MRNTIFLLVLVGGLGGGFVQVEKAKLEINKLDCAKNVILTTVWWTPKFGPGAKL